MARVLLDGDQCNDVAAEVLSCGRSDVRGARTDRRRRRDRSGRSGCSGLIERRIRTGAAREERDLIPVGNIEIDCTPVTFQTRGQVRNVVSCAVTEVLNVPVTRTIEVEVPTASGCVLVVPVVETFEVPVATTVNLPPLLVPFTELICPPGVLFPFGS